MTVRAWKSCLLVLLFLAGQANAAVVYVLGDDESENVVNPYLEAQGHTVIFDSSYYEWEGDIPEGADVVLYLSGYEYGDYTGEDGDQDAANQALLNFVANGGGLIFTEWYVYSELDEPVNDLTPVVYDGDYLYQTNWKPSEGYEDHPLVTNLVNQVFIEGNGEDDSYSLVKARNGTKVVMQNDDGNPMLSYTEKDGGTVIHINDGLSYDDFISDNILSVINSSVEFAATNVVERVSAPSALFLLILCTAGALFRRRH